MDTKIPVSQESLAGDTEETWRLSVPEFLRDLAKRVGKDKFIVAWNVGQFQEAIVNLSRIGNSNPGIRTMLEGAASAANHLAYYALEAVDMTGSEMREIQTDMERLIHLSGPKIAPGNKIILPS